VSAEPAPPTHEAGTPAEDGFPPPLGRDPNPGLRIELLYCLYDVIWSAVILVLAPWWMTRCLFDRSYRRRIGERLALVLRALPPAAPGRPRILVHGVSVGEVKASQALVAALAHEADVVVSASTDTGMEVARQLYPGLPIVRFPYDHRWPVARFLRRTRPEVVVLMELEIWPNFLRRANRSGVPVAIASGRITAASFRNYKRFGATLPQFNRVTLCAAQNEQYAERFRVLGADPARVVVTGNVKVDGLRVGSPARDGATDELARLVGAGVGQPVVVLGSTHAPEECTVVAALRARVPGVRLVVVPRHPPRAAEVEAALAEIGAPAQRLTALRAGAAPDPARPLLVDTIGELERIYGLATLVFVGGSLVEHGGQNMLEPAAQGVPVLYGPHVANFMQEAALLEGAGAALRVPDAGALAREVARLLADGPARAHMAEAALDAVRSQRGATALTLAALRARCGLGDAPPLGPDAAEAVS
jgi:3-deoxy-D-manno-octulosonic-acid transferase